MFDVLTELLSKEDEKLIAVQDDPAVMAAAAGVTQASVRKDALEAEEKQLIGLVTGRIDSYTDEKLADARKRLSIQKGTQTGWFLPEADQAREDVTRLRNAMQTAVEPARARLLAAGEAKIARLTKALHEALQPAQQLAVQISVVQRAMSDGGVHPPDHPCLCLLPDGTVDFQMRIARARGWC